MQVVADADLNDFWVFINGVLARIGIDPERCDLLMGVKRVPVVGGYMSWPVFQFTNKFDYARMFDRDNPLDFRVFRMPQCWKVTHYECVLNLEYPGKEIAVDEELLQGPKLEPLR